MLLISISFKQRFAYSIAGSVVFRIRPYYFSNRNLSSYSGMFEYNPYHSRPSMFFATLLNHWVWFWQYLPNSETITWQCQRASNFEWIDLGACWSACLCTTMKFIHVLAYIASFKLFYTTRHVNFLFRKGEEILIACNI